MAGLEDMLRSSAPGGNIGKPLLLALLALLESKFGPGLASSHSRECASSAVKTAACCISAIKAARLPPVSSSTTFWYTEAWRLWSGRDQARSRMVLVLAIGQRDFHLNALTRRCGPSHYGSGRQMTTGPGFILSALPLASLDEQHSE